MAFPRLLQNPDRREAFNRATGWLRALARIGYASKGVVYIVMGLLAARATFRVGSDIASFRGALVRFVDKPFGHTMLAVLAVGFAGYAVWQILSAIVDGEDIGEGRAALAHRLEQLFTGVVYIGLANASAHLLLEDASTATEIEYHWGNALARVPAGHAALDVVGIGLLLYAGYQVWRARSDAGLLKRVLLPPLHASVRRVILLMGRFGLVTRGLVFGVLGWLVLRAGLRHEQSVASNLGDAMREIGGGPAGPVVLAVVAMGLIAHGTYQFVNARYRRLRERRTSGGHRRRMQRGNDRRLAGATRLSV